MKTVVSKMGTKTKWPTAKEFKKLRTQMKIQNDHIQHKNKINGNVWEPHTEGKNCDKR